MLGQNCRSKSWVEFVGQIAGRIHGSNSLVELLGQILRSNSWIKFLGQIAGQTQAILGPMLASLGARMATPTDGPKTGKDGRERGKEKATLCGRGLWWLALERAVRWLVVGVAILLECN
jgi:hypothetical protein